MRPSTGPSRLPKKAGRPQRSTHSQNGRPGRDSAMAFRRRRLWTPSHARGTCSTRQPRPRQHRPPGSTQPSGRRSSEGARREPTLTDTPSTGLGRSLPEPALSWEDWVGVHPGPPPRMLLPRTVHDTLPPNSVKIDLRTRRGALASPSSADIRAVLTERGPHESRGQTRQPKSSGPGRRDRRASHARAGAKLHCPPCRLGSYGVHRQLPRQDFHLQVTWRLFTALRMIRVKGWPRGSRASRCFRQSGGVAP